MAKISDFLLGLFRNSLLAFRRHPVEILVGIAVAALASLSIENNHSFETFVTWTVTGLLVWICVFALTCLRGLNIISALARVGLTTLVTLLGAAFAIWAFDVELISQRWRTALLTISAIAALSAVPLAARQHDVEKEVAFWRFNSRLAFHLIVSAIFIFALYLGLAAALSATSALFDLKLNSDWYGHLAVWLFFAAVPWLWVSNSPAILELERPIVDGAVRWIARLGSFLILPLITIYLLITYAYALRILFTGFAPANIISPLILGAGALGFLGFYLVDPLRHRDDYGLLSRTFQAFPLAFALVLPLSVWAIWERIDQYGWTEFRYIRLLATACFALLCIVSAIQFIRRRPLSLSRISLVVAVGAALGAIGPWSVTEVSRRSQLSRLVTAADEAGGLRSDGTIDASYIASSTTGAADLTAAQVRHLSRYYGPSSMKHLTGDQDLDTWLADISPYSSTEHSPGFVHLRHDDPLPIARKGWLTHVSFYSSQSAGKAFLELPGDQGLQFGVQSMEFVVLTDDGRWTASLQPLLDWSKTETIRTGKSTLEPLLPEEFQQWTLFDEAGRDRADLILRQATIEVRGQRASLLSFRGFLIVGK